MDQRQLLWLQWDTSLILCYTNEKECFIVHCSVCGPVYVFYFPDTGLMRYLLTKGNTLLRHNVIAFNEYTSHELPLVHFGVMLSQNFSTIFLKMPLLLMWPRSVLIFSGQRSWSERIHINMRQQCFTVP